MTALIRIGCGLALALLALIDIRPAFSCACCTNEGQRSVSTVALDSGKREEPKANYTLFGDLVTAK